MASFEFFIGQLKDMGVSFYIYNLKTMSTTYYGRDGNFVFEPLNISGVEISTSASNTSIEAFLKSNPKGSIDFDSFTRDCAKLGICFWKTDLLLKKTSYFDLEDHLVYEVDLNI